MSFAAAPAMTNLLLPELSERATFAGIRTALHMGVDLALRRGNGLRVMHLRGHMSSLERARIEHVLQTEAPGAEKLRVEVVSSREMVGYAVGESDIWIATHWSTAHSLDVACKLGIIDPSRVAYLIQDYEPGFLPWSSAFVIARSTYHAGFLPIVNSRPVAQYLERFEGITVDAARVFRPRLDVSRLAGAAGRRYRDRKVRVGFYARPDKPRNLYGIGIASLHLAANELKRERVEFSLMSMGGKHRRPGGGPLGEMKVHGKVSWARYFDLLADTDVLLSLQQSPHPSHPPLDSVVSGGRSVTNDLDGVRASLSPRLTAVVPSPESLAGGIVEQVRRYLESGPDGFDDSVLRGLGFSLEEAVGALDHQFPS